MQLLRGRTTGMRQLAISPDGRYLVAGATRCDVWDLHDPKAKPRAIPTGEPPKLGRDVQFLNATQLFVNTALPPGWFRHDLESGVTTDLARPPALPWETICVQPPEGLLRVTSRRGGVFNEMVSYRVLSNAVELLCAHTTGPLIGQLYGFSPSGTHYLARAELGGEYGVKYHLYDASTDHVVATFMRPGAYEIDTRTWRFRPDGREVYMAGISQLLRYDCAAGGLPRVEMALSKSLAYTIPPLAIHPDGRLLATVEDGRVATFRDAETLEVLRRYDFAMPTVTWVAFTPDGTRCVIGNTRGKVLLFDVE